VRHFSCKYCGGKGILISSLVNYFSCQDCGSLGAKEEFSTEALSDYYNSYYTSNNLNLPSIVDLRLQKRLKELEVYRTESKSLLDIGFGAGTLLTVAERNDWRVYGTEMSESAIKAAKEKNWNVRLGSFEPDMFKINFDVICLIETIEHLSDPREIIGKIWSSLRPGGVVFGTTPNASSFNRRILGEEWSILGVPEHLNIASPGGLRSAFERVGFRMVLMDSSGFNPFDLLTRARKLLNLANKAEKDVSRVALGYTLNEMTMKSKPLSMLRSIAQAILRATDSGDSPVFKFEKPQS